MKIQILLMMVIIPQLRSWSSWFARKDADDAGTDDRLARILNTAADEIESYIAELEAKAAR
jgi:hypothetical protein